MNQRTRWLSIAAAGLAIWFILVLVFWAIRPLSDTVPVGSKGKDQPPISQTVKCNTLFSSEARDQSALPDVEPPLAYTRGACGKVHRQAQIIFAVDTLLTLIGLGIIGAVELRGRRHDQAERVLVSSAN
jgi:hypothetical protein